MKSILIRLKNPGTILSILSAILLILNELGLVIDSEKVTNILNAICYILISLGVLNNSTGKGMYIPGFNDCLNKNK